jgi:hypothetical protein
MVAKACTLILVTALFLIGCQKAAEPAAEQPAPVAQSGGGEIITPDVGAVSPATGVSLDSAAGGGVNSSAMRKAKQVAGEGVGSVKNAQGQSEDSGL